MKFYKINELISRLEQQALRNVFSAIRDLNLDYIKHYILQHNWYTL